MSRDNVRMSKIMEHNIYNHTDELYNPLRNALKKSGIPFHYNSQRSSLTPDKLAASVLTHDLRMLSPVEAENIVLLPLSSAKLPLLLQTENWYPPTKWKKLWGNTSTQSISNKK